MGWGRGEVGRTGGRGERGNWLRCKIIIKITQFSIKNSKVFLKPNDIHTFRNIKFRLILYQLELTL